MLVPFFIAPQSLSLLTSTAVHKRLLQQWAKNGILVLTEDRNKSEIFKTVGGLRTDLKKSWQAALVKHRWMSIDSGMPESSYVLSSGSALNLKASARLILADSKICTSLGMPADEFNFFLDPNLELCHLEASDQSKVVMQSLHLAAKNIRKDEVVSDIWQSRFNSLCEHSKVMVINDRFCLRRHSSPGNRSRRSSLKFILEKIASQPTGCRSVQIYSSYKTNGEIQQFETSVRNLFSNNTNTNIRKLEIFLAPDRDFGQLSHDRYVRFDNDIVELGIGIEILEGAKTDRQTTFSFKPSQKSFRSTEANLANISTVSRII